MITRAPEVRNPRYSRLERLRYGKKCRAKFYLVRTAELLPVVIYLIYMLDSFESIFIIRQADVKQECGLIRSGKFLSGISLFDARNLHLTPVFVRLLPDKSSASR